VGAGQVPAGALEVTTVAVLIGTEPAHRHSIHRAYADAVWAAGATPLLLPSPPAAARGRFVDAALERDAIMLTGGGDVDPSAYGEEAGPAVAEIDGERDAAEIAVVSAATESGVPVLGICRGIQLLAVAAGGRLFQHLPDSGYSGHWDEQRQYAPVHGIRAERGSLAELVLEGNVDVNSIHHQGVADPGRLRATAWSPDGLIEAIEGERTLGVQWHPERLLAGSGGHLGVFRWLAHAAVPA